MEKKGIILTACALLLLFAGGFATVYAQIPKQIYPANITDHRDSDGDGMPDWWEVWRGTEPAVADSAADPDGDGLINLEEFNYGTHPMKGDTDGGGYLDGEEVMGQSTTNPLNREDDGREDISVFSITLEEGDNYISFPFPPDTLDTAALFSQIYGSYKRIDCYKGAGQWSSYVPTLTLGNDLFTIDPKYALGVRMSRKATFRIWGAIPPGWQGKVTFSKKGSQGNYMNHFLIGIPCANTRNIETVLIPLSNRIDSVWSLDAESQTWKKYEVDSLSNNLEEFEPGKGYWVILKENSPPGNYAIEFQQ